MERSVRDALSVHQLKTGFQIAVVGLALAAVSNAQTPQTATENEPKDAGIFYRVDPTGNLTSLEYILAPKRFDLELKGDHSSTRFPAGVGFRFAAKLPPDAEIAVVKPYVEKGYRVVPRHFVKHQRVPEMRNGAELVTFETANYGSASTLITLPRPLAPGEYCIGIASGYDEYCFGIDPADTSALADGAAPGTPGSTSAASAFAMTNADVVKLANAGLSAEVIASAIDHAPARNFDLSIDGLIALKRAHVPDAAIQAMTRAGESASVAPPTELQSQRGTPPTPAPVSDASIERPTDTGQFYVVGPGGRLRKMESVRPSISKIERDMFEGNQVSFKLYGAHSPVRVTDPNVAIVVKITPKDNKFHLLGDFDPHDLSNMYYRRFEPVEGARQVYLSAEKRNRFASHTPDPGEFEFTVTKLGMDLYKVTPKEPLVPGEYCVSPELFSAILPINCFGVDAPR